MSNGPTIPMRGARSARIAAIAAAFAIAAAVIVVSLTKVPSLGIDDPWFTPEFDASWDSGDPDTPSKQEAK